SRSQHTRSKRDWSSDVCSSDLRGEQYETCDLPLCKDCSKEISNDHDLCPHHYSLYLQRELPNKFQIKRRSQARGYLAGLEIGGEIGRASCRERGSGEEHVDAME